MLISYGYESLSPRERIKNEGERWRRPVLLKVKAKDGSVHQDIFSIVVSYDDLSTAR